MYTPDLSAVAALTFLYHLLYYLGAHGKQYTLSNFMPALGLRVGPGKMAALVGTLVLACVFTLTQGTDTSSILLLIITSVYLACKGWRLSNHLFLAYFLLVCATAASAIWPADVAAGFETVIAFGVLPALYTLALTHKLNDSFLDPKHSYAVAFAESYFRLPATLPRVFLPITALAAYLLIALLLFVPNWYKLALLLGVGIHFLYGLAGNPHFSVTVLLIYCSILPEASWSFPSFLAVFAALAVFPMRFVLRSRITYANVPVTLMAAGVFSADLVDDSIDT